MTAIRSTFQKYSAYKDSDVAWLGELPKHWQEVPLCTLTKLKSVNNCSELELLSVYLDLGVIKFSEVEAKRTNGTSQDLSKYQRVDIGDFVLNNQQAWRGSVGVSNHLGIVSPAYLVLELSSKLHNGYANYMFRSGYMVGQYLINSKGVGTIQRNLYWPSLRRAKVILPPLPEQTAIASFLDEKTAKIDLAIAQKEKMITLLKERKQIIIQNAVTKGLNPNAKMKDSGVEWIGEIPEHWNILPLLSISKLRKISNLSHRDLLSVYLNLGVIRFEDVEEKRTNATSEDLSNYQAVEIGDLVLNNQQAWRGSVGVSKYVGIISPAYIVLNLSDCIISQYANFLFRDSSMISHYVLASKGVGTIQRNLYWQNLKRAPIIIPPKDEQIKILNFLNSEINKIDLAIENQEQQIIKAKELKSTLIDSAVTGKIKVS